MPSPTTTTIWSQGYRAKAPLDPSFTVNVEELFTTEEKQVLPYTIDTVHSQVYFFF
jgi:hypothetical protein